MSEKDSGKPSYRTFSVEHIQELLNPHETWVMRIQSLLVWESPVRSIIFLLFFNFLFWLFAISSYRFFYVLGSCVLVFYMTHSWLTKIWPEIRVPVPPEDVNDDWTYVHPVLLNVPELSEKVAENFERVHWLNEKFWELRERKPGRFCLYTSSLCVLGVFAGWHIPGRLLVYVPAVCLLLWPCVHYNNLLSRFYRKFRPFFSQLDRGMDIQRSHHKARRPVVAEESDSDLDEFIPQEFAPVTRLSHSDRLPVHGESTCSSLASSRSTSPFQPSDLDVHRQSVDVDMVAPPVFAASGSLETESSSSLIPTAIPDIDDLDSTINWAGAPIDLTTPSSTPAKPTRRRRKHEKREEDFSGTESYDENVEELLAEGLDVPDLQNVPADDATMPNYLAAVAGQTVAEMGRVGAVGLTRLAEYIKGAETVPSTVEIQEIRDGDDDVIMQGDDVMGRSAGDFEFIEHEDLPGLDD